MRPDVRGTVRPSCGNPRASAEGPSQMIETALAEALPCTDSRDPSKHRREQRIALEVQAIEEPSETLRQCTEFRTAIDRQTSLIAIKTKASNG